MPLCRRRYSYLYHNDPPLVIHSFLASHTYNLGYNPNPLSKKKETPVYALLLEDFTHITSLPRNTT